MQRLQDKTGRHSDVHACPSPSIGLQTESLNKASVKILLEDARGYKKEVLELRQLISKSSVRKYNAMENAVCKDKRARGLLQFYGANRTGRFAGRLIQVQNLPQNHLPDLKQARSLVKDGYFKEGEKVNQLQIDDKDMTFNGRKIKSSDLKKYRGLVEKYSYGPSEKEGRKE